MGVEPAARFGGLDALWGSGEEASNDVEYPSLEE